MTTASVYGRIAEGYRIVGRIRRGPDATVYHAIRETGDTAVALKVLRTDAHIDDDLSHLRRLPRHPNIVRLLDIGRTLDGRAYLAMEYFPDGSYDDLVKRSGPLPVDEVVRVGIAVAEALQATHESGLIHRDVTPGNILRGPNGPALTDFGIAAVPSELAGTVALDRLTPPHAPPEALLRQRQDARADVYSLGSTLWTLLAGHPPFAAKGAASPDPFEFRDRALKEPVPPVPDATIPMWLQATLRKAMAKLPEHRYPSAVAFVTALRERNEPWPADAPSSGDLPPATTSAPSTAATPTAVAQAAIPRPTASPTTIPPIINLPITRPPATTIPRTINPPATTPPATAIPPTTTPPAIAIPPATTPPATVIPPTNNPPATAMPATAMPAAVVPEAMALTSAATLPVENYQRPPESFTVGAPGPRQAGPPTPNVEAQWWAGEGGSPEPDVDEHWWAADDRGLQGPPEHYYPDEAPRRPLRGRLLATSAVVTVIAAIGLAAFLFNPLSGTGNRQQNGAAPTPTRTATVGAGPSTPAPTVVAGMAPQGVGLTDERVAVTLSWRDQTNGEAVFYVVGTPTGGSPATLANAARGATSVRVNGLNPTVDYCFILVAALSIDEVASSEQICTHRFGTPSPTPKSG